MGEITQLLGQARAGDRGARDELFGQVYRELTALARQRLAAGPLATQIDAPSLVHEAYLRLTRSDANLRGADRNEFLAYASTVMRNVVIDSLREKQAQRRGAGAQRVTLLTGDAPMVLADTQLEALTEALEALAQAEPLLHRIVEQRFFGGLALEEIAGIEHISLATAKRHWQKARAYLHAALQN
jgi:RNA polymerase sigma factor (TIGR02999 family)